ncbi:hypothetical protein [Halosegnis marinus]|uniref:Uncharacterized protein n=1 Tax=Halosegnis marinus TaxID=3034023 RepID=A0ABD5ZKB2_9EURY|nr:hypothetical protein [Halosegnis sp. DT85]
MATTEGTFRVYRVLDAVAHLNLLDTAESRLYTVFESGYPDDLQATVDGLATGALVSGTVEGDPDDPDEPWHLLDAERDPDRSVLVDFATGVRYPEVAREAWDEAGEAAGDDPVRPTGRALGHDGDPAGEVWVQPRDALPDGAFTLPAVAGRLPLEPWLRELPYTEERPAELLVVDAGGPGEPTTEPYGVLLFFTAAGHALADRYRERWDLPRGADSRPDFDPY